MMEKVGIKFAAYLGGNGLLWRIITKLEMCKFPLKNEIF